MKIGNYCFFILLFALVYSQPDVAGRFCRTPCKKGTQCINGMCSKNSLVLGSASARTSQKQIKNIQSNSCSSTTSCQFGYCLPQKCSPCPRGSNCLSVSSCPSGFTCVGNKCQRDCQSKCPIGTICLSDPVCSPIPYNIQKC